MLTLMTLGDQIRAERKRLRLSQSTLAQIAGVSRAQIDRLENGRAADMGFVLILRLLHALNLDFTVQTYNRGRPTLDELIKEDAL